MTQTIDELQRFGFKLFFEPDVEIETRAFIPVFHHWIRTHAISDLLIDVADYTHLSDGPSVLLAGHEGNYAIDRSEGRVGLYYYRKQPTTGTLAERLLAVARVVISAGILLENDESVGSVCRFRGDEIQFVANDRLRAPATAGTAETLQPLLATLAKTLFREKSSGVVTPGPDHRLRMSLGATDRFPLSSLLDNIS